MMQNLWKTVIAAPVILFLSYPCKSGTDDEVTIPQKSYTTQRISSAPPDIDGVLDDEAWNVVDWASDFTQISPNDGKAPTYQTKFKFIYDDKYVYLGVYAFDAEPQKIEKRLGRRDEFPGDWVEVNIDSYNDKRTAYSFTLSASGVRSDEYVSENGNNWDGNWDPIWMGKTEIVSDGWTAEFKIPLSQLRYAHKDALTWGLQVNRRFFRNDERSSWQYIPQDAGGWVHLFGELRGLKGVKPQKQIELQPYVLGQIEKFPGEDPENPFFDKVKPGYKVGLDGKIGITSDITLDFTINPDFGQVEADPSQVNLSAFELFFDERRPFFIEGNNILTFPITDASSWGWYNQDNLYYSRRIGRAPSYYPDADFVDQPDFTTILGALKITGRNKNGLSWGVSESVTRYEKAKVMTEGEEIHEQGVEPLSNYLIGRLQQEVNGANTVFGVELTAVNRNIKDDHLKYLHKEAYTGGLDFLHQWKDRKYFVYYRQVFSRVGGDPEAISETQQSSRHLFQLPDADYLTYDSTRTSLTGTGGTFKAGKQSGDVVFEIGATYRSPEVELNDIGFLNRADGIAQFGWGQYRKLKPFSIFNSFRVNLNEQVVWDFGGNYLSSYLNTNFHIQFKNFWRLGSGYTREFSNVSNNDLRGGPALKYPGGHEYWYYVGSDNRKRLRVHFNNWYYWGDQNFAKVTGYFLRFNYRPIDALSISLAPNLNERRNEMQYIDAENLDGGTDYAVATINQQTMGMRIRINFSINPDINIQYYGQPFIFTARYEDFKLISNSKADNYTDRFQLISEADMLYNEEAGNYLHDDEYLIDKNGDGSADVKIPQPDFNFQQFRSNMVLRWEYKPGSTVFLVWAQEKNASTELGLERSFGRLSGDLIRESPYNIFLIKFTYRFLS